MKLKTRPVAAVAEPRTRRWSREEYYAASLYALAGIQEYWIINLVARQLEVHRDPIPDAKETHGFRYDHVTTMRVGDVISPLAAQQAVVRVADLLP